MAENDPPSKKDFFISYNKADCEWAEWITQQPEQLGGYTAVVQAWDFRPGGNFVLDMHRAVQTCDRTLAVLSPDYLTSVFTAPEWAAAFGADSTGFQRKLVPVRVRDCKPDGLLSNIGYIDLLNLNAEKAGKALLAGVAHGPVDRKAPRPFPGMVNAAMQGQPRPPGMLPDIWNIPHLRNPNFTEPGQRLTEMHDALFSGKPAALTQALSGLGGVGKTQLAVEHAYRYAQNYVFVWWVRCEHAATLAADYAALATELDLPEREAQEQPAIIEAVREALQHRRDWLLVFDNANAPEEIRNYLPATGGHVLITSRYAAWGGVAQAVPVKKWATEVAVEFLLKRTGQTNAEAANELALELDCLPLALEQAAAYIDSAQKTLPGYLARFREHKLALLKRGIPSTDYPATVETTWELSFRCLEKESPGGAALLKLCAFFAPDDIPRDVIVSGAENLPKPLCKTVGDGLALDDAVKAIRRYSLLEVRDESIFSMHRLVQEVIRERLGPAERRLWAEIAVELVNKAFPHESTDTQTWKECDRLLPHAIAVADFAEASAIRSGATAWLANQVGGYAWGRAEYGQAKAAFERAINILERVAPNDPNLGSCINNLGSVLLAIGEFDRAKTTFERALQIGEQAYGRDHPNLATTINNLGSVLRSLGDLTGAKIAFERAVKIDERAFGSHHPSLANHVNSLGMVLKDLGDLTGARNACERALKIDESTLGLEHPTIGNRVNNLGTVLKALGDVAGAKIAYERAVKINERAFGPDHPNVAYPLNNLGGALQDLGDLAGAKVVYERALKINEKALGPTHPNVATTINNLGRVHKDLGDLAGARTQYERALKIAEGALGPSHPSVAVCINNLGCLLDDLGDASGAKTAFERALKIAEAVFTSGHPIVATYVNNLGGALEDLGDINGAEAAYRRALEIFQRSLGEDNPDTRVVRARLASLLR